MKDISMFGEVEQYLASGLTQREFANGKTYTLDSFKYWIKKYRISSGQTKDEQNYTTSCFNEIHLKDHFSNNRKLIELVTKSGTHVTIYEQMLYLSINTKVFVYSQSCDMRKGFDSLSGIVSSQMELDPTNGYMFVFFNKNRTLVKILSWDIDGFYIYYKRLEKGTFKRPTACYNVPNYEITQDELYMILRGIDFEKSKKRKRYLSKKNVD